jgi:glycosyltransferase involved in cell wall biosynthesis
VNKLGVAKSKIDVVPNGVDEIFLSDYRGTPAEVPDDYLLYVGGMHERKNVGGVLEAYFQMKDSGMISHDLVLVGPGEKRAYEPANVDRTTIEQRDDVHVMGFISPQELKFVYRNADVFLYPSRYEGFGIPPLEAMASGTPVVASNVTAMPEVLGDAAVLVDPEDIDALASATQKLLDENERSKYIARGKKQANNYTWERAARITAEILSKVVE